MVRTLSKHPLPKPMDSKVKTFIKSPVGYNLSQNVLQG